MLQPSRLINALSILILPTAAFSHPGHLDDMPTAHDLAHGFQYAVALIALGIAAHVVRRILLARAKRKLPTA